MTQRKPFQVYRRNKSTRGRKGTYYVRFFDATADDPNTVIATRSSGYTSKSDAEA